MISCNGSGERVSRPDRFPMMLVEMPFEFLSIYSTYFFL